MKINIFKKTPKTVKRRKHQVFASLYIMLTGSIAIVIASIIGFLYISTFSNYFETGNLSYNKFLHVKRNILENASSYESSANKIIDFTQTVSNIKYDFPIPLPLSILITLICFCLACISTINILKKIFKHLKRSNEYTESKALEQTILSIKKLKKYCIVLFVIASINGIFECHKVININQTSTQNEKCITNLINSSSNLNTLKVVETLLDNLCVTVINSNRYYNTMLRCLFSIGILFTIIIFQTLILLVYSHKFFQQLTKIDSTIYKERI